jgi:hypothetical protein
MHFAPTFPNFDYKVSNSKENFKGENTMIDQPAFPNEGFNGWGEPFQGMTLRDYFAAQAITGLLTAEIVGGYTNEHVIAEISYRIADAMLKAR